MPASQTAGLRIAEPVQFWVGNFIPFEFRFFFARRVSTNFFGQEKQVGRAAQIGTRKICEAGPQMIDWDVQDAIRRWAA